jgi:putative ABC transport system permease protein
LHGLLQDLRYALRTMWKAPTFTAIAILTLALGIGANTAVFSIVNKVLLRPLPYENPQQLVKIWGALKKEGIPKNWISEPEWLELKDSKPRSFSGLAAFSSGNGANFSTGNGQASRVTLSQSTASLFPLLGVQAVQGRTFSTDEDQPGRKVAVVSQTFWTSKLGSDPNALGRTIQLDTVPYTLIGILPAGFEFGGPADVWTPLAIDRAKPQDRGSHYLEIVGRINAGTTPQQAENDIQAFARQLGREFPQYYRAETGWDMSVVSLHTELVGDVRPALLVLMGAVGFVLLIACANLANLLLAKASARQKEIAIRIALGANRWRIVRQLLSESVLLACMGGVLGVLLATWCVSLMKSLAPASLPNVAGLSVDLEVLVFAFAVSVITGIIFGLAPAVQASRSDTHDPLKEAGRGTTAGTSVHRLRSSLVVGEVALALALVVGAGLMIRSLRRLLAVDPGFQTAHLVTMRLALPEEKYKTGPAVPQFYQNLLERVRTLPGVQAGGAISQLPMGQSYSSGSVFIDDTSIQGAQMHPTLHLPYIETDRRNATPGYFDAMKIPVIRGRVFADSDAADTQFVALVDSDFANRFWPGKDPIGKRIAIDRIPDADPKQMLLRWRTIVGVVQHVSNYSLDTRGREQAYFPEAQRDTSRNMTVVVRAVGDPTALVGSIRSQLAQLDPDQPLYDVRTMDEWIDASLSTRRFNMFLLIGFGTLALLLASVGIYGVMSYSVTQRTHEFGIRMALGASRGSVLKMVMSNALRMAGMGVAIGIVLALVSTRLMSTMLFGVGTADPLTLALTIIVLPAVALLASYIPARRATRVDPMIALRYE